eukprot:1203607-Rhodomonas_salina.1
MWKLCRGGGGENSSVCETSKTGGGRAYELSGKVEGRVDWEKIEGRVDRGRVGRRPEACRRRGGQFLGVVSGRGVTVGRYWADKEEQEGTRRSCVCVSSLRQCQRPWRCWPAEEVSGKVEARMPRGLGGVHSKVEVENTGFKSTEPSNGKTYSLW